MENYCVIKPNIIKSNIKKKYLLSTSFFYLEKSYKSSDKYINGIEKVIEFVNQNEFYVLRIYYDKTIFLNSKYLELFEKIGTNEQVELCEYTCSTFLRSSPFHIGTFGTLLRFLPLFEKSDFEVIFILDIDDSIYEYIKLYVNDLINSNKKFYFNILENYGERYLNKFNNKFGNTALANIYVKNYRFNIRIFTDFLNWISKSNKLFKTLEYINKKIPKFKNATDDIVQTYGLDEYFLNICMINTLNGKDIGWIKENYYFDYFINNLLIKNNRYKFYDLVMKNYYLSIINILDNDSKYQNYTTDELKDIFYNVVKISSQEYEELKEKFLSNYFEFCKKYKKITLEYYNKYFFIFNEIYIDDFIINNFGGISWYINKKWDKFPKYITSNIDLSIH